MVPTASMAGQPETSMFLFKRPLVSVLAGLAVAAMPLLLGL